ncbi:hypothetical protein ACYZT4_10890 [Pseudomonas sp. GB2N2]
MMGDIQKTPAAKWRQEGQVDPHGEHYNCQRAALTLGELTDDELANGVFLHGNEPLNINALLRKTPGYHSAVVWLTAGKDRIRWLSRALEESAAREQALQLLLNAADERADLLEVALRAALDATANPAPLEYSTAGRAITVGSQERRTDEREEFIAWVRREWPQAPLSNVRDLLPKNDPRYGEYCDETLQRAWVGWQARAAL